MVEFDISDTPLYHEHVVRVNDFFFLLYTRPGDISPLSCIFCSFIRFYLPSSICFFELVQSNSGCVKPTTEAVWVSANKYGHWRL